MSEDEGLSSERRSEVAVVRAVAAALAHPLRGKLVITLDARPGLGVAELGERVGEPVSRVRRHLQALVDDGLVGVEAMEERRGATKRYYRLTERAAWIDIEDEKKLSGRERRLSTVGVVRAILDSVIRAISNPSLAERTDRLVAQKIGDVDGRGWAELSVLHHELLDQALAVVEESQERLEAGTEEPITVVSAQVLLEIPSPGPEAS